MADIHLPYLSRRIGNGCLGNKTQLGTDGGTLRPRRAQLCAALVAGATNPKKIPRQRQS
jgi:hypothetical protein